MERLILLILLLHHRCLRFLLPGILLISLSTSVFAQDVTVRAGFVEDSLMVGDQGRFYLTARYPQEKTMLFPDSTFSFIPFEYEKREYYPTETTNGKSYDSVIYYLSTFEIDRVQQLKLPVFEITAADSIPHFSNTDSILLTQLVTLSLDTIPAEELPLKRNVAYQNVMMLFNYPVALIITSALLVLIAVTWFVFGKKIKRYFRKRKLLQLHATFSAEYATCIQQLKNAFTPQSTEAALVIWKKYMEQLEAKPYTKLTTRETQVVNPDAQLISALKTIDGAIYGYAHPETLIHSLEHLQTFANHHFETRLKEVSHGR